MKALLVYPGYPDTFWSFKHALKIIAKRAAFPPLGLLTVAAMLPGDWQKRLVDMNVSHLSDDDIRWADYVFISANTVQRESAKQVIRRCQELGAKTVAGGPLFTTEYEDFEGVHHFVLGEGEVTLPLFLKDVENGKPHHLYYSEERPDISQTPVPLWSLINMKKYASMNLQYSRGCPFDCEFCDIVFLNGRQPRTKSTEQVVRELEAIYERGWRRGVFVVDDNFIGNRKKLRQETLPAIIGWQEKRKYPFALSTEASINLADDDELMRLMVRAGFNQVFIGIETPNEDSLLECNKSHNVGRDLMAAVKKIQNLGIEVQGGFIVGFDSDPASIFRSQINFIQKSGIVTAMVGLLNAPRGTRLYQRLKREKRLVQDFTGDNMDGCLNFMPKMNPEALVEGYRSILKSIYSPRSYYERIKVFLKEYHPPKRKHVHVQFHYVRAFVRSVWFLGIRERGRRYYWRLLFSTLFRRPRVLPVSITLAVYGFHFRKVVEKLLEPRNAAQKA